MPAITFDILPVGITCAFHSLWEWRPAAIIAARGRSTKAQFMTVESIACSKG